MADKIKEEDIVDGDLWAKTKSSTEALIKLVTDLENQLKGFAEVSKKALGGASKTSNFDDLKKSNAEIDKLNKAFKDKLKLDKQKEALLKQEVLLRNARVKSVDKSIKAAQKERKSTVDSANAFKRLSKQVNNAQARFKRLAAQYGENDKRTKAALKTFNKLDARLRSINQTARDGRRDVGRYGTAFSGLFRSVKNIATGLFIVQGLRLIGNAIRDAFNRIKEFDSELQNIAGITGTTRESLKDLEAAITFVSKSSIKTSVEVAKLATTLFTLGKTKEEVKLLLKPVNDLAIAFRVSSDSAADFLGQTLNAFGKSAGSAQRFADIIANVRTSTSLDFERIKDGLGFIAPTANALNLTLGETSALLGTLQDNGVRAARAGRLLNSSFARIIDRGLTLDEALEQINESQNKIATSSELFGKEALALGLILAKNIEKTAKLSDEFDNLSDGSLEELTSKQLDSLASKLTILDSTWEALIFTIENGTGTIATFFKTAAEGTTDWLESIRKGQLSPGEFLDENLLERTKEWVSDLEAGSTASIKRRKDQLNAELKALDETGLKGEQLLKKRKELQADFDRFKKGADEEEKNNAIKLYEQDLEKIQTKYYSAGIFDAEGFEIEKLKIQEKYNKRTDDARLASFRETKKVVEKIINTYKGIEVIEGVELDLENTKQQFEDFGELAGDFKKLGQQTGTPEEIAAEKQRIGRIFTELTVQQERLKVLKALLNEENKFEKLEITKSGRGKKKVEEAEEIVGLINKQAKVVADLQNQIAESEDEGFTISLGFDLAEAEEELARLKRQAFSTREEFEKQQIDLIEDRIDREIALEERKSKELIKLIKSNQKVISKEEQDLIEKEEKRLFDFKIKKEIERRNIKIKEEADLARAEFEKTRTGFKTEEAFLKEKEAQFTAIKRKELQNQLQILEFFASEENKVEREQIRAKIAALDKLGKERVKLEVDVIALLEALNEKYFSDQLDKVDRQISDLEKRERNLQDLANRGQQEASDSLAENQKNQAVAAKKREDLLQKEKQFELALAVIGAFNTALEKPGATTSTALTEAITSTTVLTSFVQSLPSFFDGTTDTGSNGSLDSNGGHLAMLHDNERVVDKKNNIKMGGVSNEDAANIVHDFNNDLLSYNTPQLTVQKSNWDSNEQVLQKFDELKKDIVGAINNKETYLGSDIDTMKKIILQSYQKGGTRTTVKSKYPTRR
jgi:hypothetical protein